MDRLAEIKQRLAMATPGPWRIDRMCGRDWIAGANGDILASADDIPSADVVLVREAPADLAFLVAEVERLTLGPLSGPCLVCCPVCGVDTPLEAGEWLGPSPSDSNPEAWTDLTCGRCHVIIATVSLPAELAPAPKAPDLAPLLALGRDWLALTAEVRSLPYGGGSPERTARMDALAAEIVDAVAALAREVGP